MGVKIRERPKGSGVWWIYVDYRGKRKAKKIGSLGSAEEVKRQVEARLVLGKEFLPPERPVVPTLGDYFKKFQLSYLDDAAVRQTTRRGYISTFKNHILPVFKSKRLDEIARDDVEEFIGELVKQRNLAKNTIRLILSNLSAVMEHAMEHAKEKRRLIQINPVSKVTKFYKQARKVHQKIEPLTAEEVPVFLQAVVDNFPDHYPLFLCAIHTGMRSGELAGLQWGDIDFRGKYASVQRNVVNGRINPTKTDKDHNVDLSDQLLVALEELKRKRQAEWLKKGKNEIPDWVFSTREGNPAQMQSIVNRVYKQCLDRAKLRRRRFHDLRHTTATLMLEKGEPMAYVKEQLGHTSIKTTVDVYGHIKAGKNRDAVNRLPGLESKLPLVSEQAAR